MIINIIADFHYTVTDYDILTITIFNDIVAVLTVIYRMLVIVAVNVILLCFDRANIISDNNDLFICHTVPTASIQINTSVDNRIFSIITFNVFTIISYVISITLKCYNTLIYFNICTTIIIVNIITIRIFFYVIRRVIITISKIHSVLNGIVVIAYLDGLGYIVFFIANGHVFNLVTIYERLVIDYLVSCAELVLGDHLTVIGYDVIFTVLCENIVICIIIVVTELFLHIVIVVVILHTDKTVYIFILDSRSTYFQFIVLNSNRKIVIFHFNVPFILIFQFACRDNRLRTYNYVILIIFFCHIVVLVDSTRSCHSIVIVITVLHPNIFTAIDNVSIDCYIFIFSRIRIFLCRCRNGYLPCTIVIDERCML